MKPQDIVALARETFGTPYLHQGRVNGVALDCAGVPRYVGERLGYPIEVLARYGRQPVPAEMRDALDKHLIRVTKENMQLGDVVWMRFRDGEPQHLGILGDYRYGGFSLIHAYNGSGLKSVVEHGLDAQWLARIVAVWRFPEVEA